MGRNCCSKTVDMLEFKTVAFKPSQHVNPQKLVPITYPYVLLYINCVTAIIADLSISGQHPNAQQPLWAFFGRLKKGNFGNFLTK